MKLTRVRNTSAAIDCNTAVLVTKDRLALFTLVKTGRYRCDSGESFDHTRS